MAFPLLLTACGTEVPSEPVPAPQPPAAEVPVEVPSDPVETTTDIIEAAETVLTETANEVEAAPIDVDIPAVEVSESETQDPIIVPADSAPREAVETPVAPLTETEIEEVSVELPAPAGLTGTFSYDTSYGTPKGVTPMTVTFQVNDGVVDSFSLAGNPQHKISVDHQVLYQDAVGQYVIGKAIEDLNVVPLKLNGASLTGIGFKTALDKLMAEA